MAKILLVDDDSELCDSISRRLTSEQHILEYVENGDEADRRLRFYEYDCIVLDWMLPGLSGPEICKNFRGRGGKTPVIILSGRDSVEDRELGLDSGADDYLVKPFSVRELAARIRALLRRPAVAEPAELSAGNLRLNTLTREITVDSKPVHLRPKEFELLCLLLKNRDHVYSAEALIDKLWNGEPDISVDSVRAVLTRLRKKIDVPHAGSIIVTVHGRGYKIDSSKHKQDF